MRISIFGLGYVGTVSAGCLASQGHQVRGVDLNELKVELVNRGVSPVLEPGTDELLKAARDQGHLSATTDAQAPILDSDASFICVGTPSNGNGSLNLIHVERVAEQIGEALRLKGDFHSVVLRSTVLPGTTEAISSLIARRSGKQPGRDFGVAVHPEFLREGSAVWDFWNPPYTVVGTTCPRSTEMLKGLYSQLEAPFHLVSPREAELLKYACNAFHAAKVVFANEIGSIAKRLGIDGHVVLDLLCADKKLNISAAYLKPGLAFGGSCLPKDVRALSYLSRSYDVGTSMIDSLLYSNSLHIQRIVNWVIERGRRRLGIFGLSFKSGTDDLRESPSVQIVETLLGKGFSIAIYDRNVNIARLVGANRDYIEKEIPHVASLMRSRAQDVIDFAELIVLANEAAECREVLAQLRPDQEVLDLVRVAEKWDRPKGGYEGICW